MDQVLQGLRWSHCLVYLDDIISFGTTFGDALDNLTSIFERLRMYGLQLKSTKCHLFQTSVVFLSHVVGRRGLECDPKKIEDVKCWPVPDCLKSVCQFLGFVGYYRRFIPSFADIAEPLVALTGKDVPFVWRPECATAFLLLRDALILAFPGTTCWIQMLVILAWVEYLARSRMTRNGSLLTAVVLSGHLSVDTAPQNERCWRLSPCVYNFVPTYAALIIRTDHKSLVWLHRFKDTEGMMARWLHTLQQFQLSIGLDEIIVTLMDCPGSLRPLVVSVLVWIAPVWTRRWK